MAHIRAEIIDDEEPRRLMDFQDEPQSDGIDGWKQTLKGAQRTSLFLAHGLAIASMIVTISWISKAGGLSWKEGESKIVFNWHPLMMIAAFNFMTVATLSFRYRNVGTRKLVKLLHGMSWMVALLCMVVGLVAVFKSHNDGVSGYIANMYSLHSWVGIFIFAVYILQFFGGLLTFGFPAESLGITPAFKAKMLFLHQFFGPIIYLSVMVTILLGIQEKEGFVGCSYEVDEADLTPWKNFSKIPGGCQLSHLMGFLVLLTGVCTSFALHSFDRGDYRSN